MAYATKMLKFRENRVAYGRLMTISGMAYALLDLGMQRTLVSVARLHSQ